MEASTGCRPENLGLCGIQLEPIGAHPPGHIVDASRDAVLKLQRCRRTAEHIELGVLCIQIRAEISSSKSAVYNKNRTDPLWYATQNQR